MQVRHGDAGVHGVHAHADRRHLDRRASRELIHRRFADAVREHAGKRSETVDARDVDHRAFPCREVRRGGAHQTKRRGDVDRHHRIPRLVGRLVERAARDHARRVDEDVERAGLVERRFDDPVRGLGRRDVGATDHGASSGGADVLGDVGQGTFFASHRDDNGALAPERFRRRASDAAGRAGDDDGLISKCHGRRV